MHWVGRGFHSPPCLSSFDSCYICEHCILRGKRRELRPGLYKTPLKQADQVVPSWMGCGEEPGTSRGLPLMGLGTTVMAPAHTSQCHTGDSPPVSIPNLQSALEM